MVTRMPAMSVLALDPSSKAIGWAVADAAGSRCGAWRPQLGAYGKQSLDQRHMELCGRAGSWLADIITEFGPEVAVIECGGGYRTDKCSERLRGALFLVLWTREIATVPVDPKVWRAYAKRCLPEWLTKFDADGKPDDRAAAMILEWWLTTQADRVEAA